MHACVTTTHMAKQRPELSPLQNQLLCRSPPRSPPTGSTWPWPQGTFLTPCPLSLRLLVVLLLLVDVGRHLPHLCTGGACRKCGSKLVLHAACNAPPTPISSSRAANMCSSVPNLPTPTASPTCRMLSSATLATTQSSFAFHEKSDTLEVWPPCMNNSSGGPSSASSGLCGNQNTRGSRGGDG